MDAPKLTATATFATPVAVPAVREQNERQIAIPEEDEGVEETHGQEPARQQIGELSDMVKVLNFIRTE